MFTFLLYALGLGWIMLICVLVYGAEGRGRDCLWPSLFSRTNLNEFACVCVGYSKSYKYTYETNNAIFCVHVLSKHCYFCFCTCLWCIWNESNKYASSGFTLVFAVTVWILCISFDSTRIWGARGYVFLCLLSADASCFFTLLLRDSTSFFSRLLWKNTYVIYVTLLLFLAAFSIASRKIQKGKVHRMFFLLLFSFACVVFTKI